MPLMYLKFLQVVKVCEMKIRLTKEAKIRCPERYEIYIFTNSRYPRYDRQYMNY